MTPTRESLAGSEALVLSAPQVVEVAPFPYPPIKLVGEPLVSLVAFGEALFKVMDALRSVSGYEPRDQVRPRGVEHRIEIVDVRCIRRGVHHRYNGLAAVV
jgi:hypothetical protein